MQCLRIRDDGFCAVLNGHEPFVANAIFAAVVVVDAAHGNGEMGLPLGTCFDSIMEMGG